MPHIRTISIAALNIAMGTPHSAERYVKLLARAYSKKRPIMQGQLRAIMLGSLHGYRNWLPGKELTGEVYRFVRIDPNEPWFNSQTQAPATEEEIEGIAIPPHLLPHLQRIPFVFRPTSHTLFFVSRDRNDNLGPSSAARFFETLLHIAATELEYPEVSVTVLPERGAIEKLLATPRLSRIEIDLVPPNPDDAGDVEAELLRRLDAQRARKMQTTLTAKRNETLQPDEDTATLARIASRNGFVTVHGRDAEGLPTKASTVDKPMIRSIHVDSDMETTLQVLSRVAEEEGS